MRTRKHKPLIAPILTVSLLWLILSAGGDGNVKKHRIHDIAKHVI